MADVPRVYIEHFTQGINAISASSQEALRQELLAIDYSNMTKAIDKIVSLMEFFCSVSSEAAATLAAEFYRGMSLAQTGDDYDAEAFSAHLASGTEAAVRGIVQTGVNGQLLAMIDELVQRVDYETKRAAGDTVMQNANADPRDVKYARVPTGNETCPWCIALASRGFVYASAQSAGIDGHYHAHCDCRIVPSFGESVEGYYPDQLYEQYLGFRDTLAGGRLSREATSLEEALNLGKAQLSTTNEVMRFIRDATSFEDLKRRVEVLNAEAPYHHFTMQEQMDIRRAMWSKRDSLLKG